VPTRNLKKIDGTLDGDGGIFYSTAEGLAKLKPVMPGGTVTFGGQTHPADGNAGMIVASAERARELSRNPAIRIELLGFGQSRAQLAHMPEAPVPAAQAALRNAQIAVGDLAAVKTHNPFAVNDIVLARQTGFPAGHEQLRLPLIWEHPCTPVCAR
jgi:acetyl-CoA acetyltransferase